MKKRAMITEHEFENLLEALRQGTIKTAKEQKWRPSELAMTLADLPNRILKKFIVTKPRSKRN